MYKNNAQIQLKFETVLTGRTYKCLEWIDGSHRAVPVHVPAFQEILQGRLWETPVVVMELYRKHPRVIRTLSRNHTFDAAGPWGPKVSVSVCYWWRSI